MRRLVKSASLYQDSHCLQSDAAKKKKTDEPTEDVVPEEDKVFCCKREWAWFCTFAIYM